jgi:type IV pili sensor histidine kinase/response regulator
MTPRTALLLTALAIASGCAVDKTPPPAATAQAAAVAERKLAVYRIGDPVPTPPRTATGRYSYVDNGPDAAQIDPLLAVIDVSIPQTLATVEDAADYLLRRTGYSLKQPGTPEVRHLLGLPLPQVHRHLGPMTLREALLALGGRAFVLAVDETYREVGYQASAVGGTP